MTITSISFLALSSLATFTACDDGDSTENRPIASRTFR
jgi:hypothetical protein